MGQLGPTGALAVHSANDRGRVALQQYVIQADYFVSVSIGVLLGLRCSHRSNRTELLKRVDPGEAVALCAGLPPAYTPTGNALMLSLWQAVCGPDPPA